MPFPYISILIQKENSKKGEKKNVKWKLKLKRKQQNSKGKGGGGPTRAPSPLHPPDFAPAVLQGRSKGPGQYNAHAFFIHNDQQVNGLTSDKK